jgi:predicted metalloendopeptidase
MRDEYVRQWLGSSVYPPFQYRANGPVSHLAGFYEAFGVKPGDRLFVEPAGRVVFW